MALEPIGDIADVSLTVVEQSSYPHVAQMLSRRGHDVEAALIQDQSELPANEAQMYYRRNYGNQVE